MEGKNEITPITMDQFLPTVIRFKMEERRLVQICAARLPDGYELSYSFCRGYDMETLRLGRKSLQHHPDLSLRLHAGK